jgi:hypothetical protein
MLTQLGRRGGSVQRPFFFEGIEQLEALVADTHPVVSKFSIGRTVQSRRALSMKKTRELST